MYLSPYNFCDLNITRSTFKVDKRVRSYLSEYRVCLPKRLPKFIGPQDLEDPRRYDPRSVIFASRFRIPIETLARPLL